jgi:hypothetical protein
MSWCSPASQPGRRCTTEARTPRRRRQPIWGKRDGAEDERGREEIKGRWLVSALGGAWSGGGDEESSPAGAIYRPARSVVAARYFSPAGISPLRMCSKLGHRTMRWRLPSLVLFVLSQSSRGLIHGAGGNPAPAALYGLDKL